jgi:thiol:disulfide interchange protein DsbD
MLATALWLASLVADRYGERAWWLAIFLVFVAIAAWIFGAFVQRGSRARGSAVLVALGVLALGYVWVLEGLLQWRSPLDSAQVAAVSLRNAPKGYAWQRWHPDAVNQARAEGRSVIVDFTAKWCITCNTIVKPALERPAVVAELSERNVAAFVADYTDYGADITAAMKQFNRAAVPLVLIYPANTNTPPLILPDPNPLLGPGSYAEIVLAALREANP